MFDDANISEINHYAPLHYLPFIGRTRCLKSKPALCADGFQEHHFRSKSKRSDVERGFEKFAFLTIDDQPRIVQAKLKGGFPHIALNVPVAALLNHRFDLCRYNVAMTRMLRRNGKPGHTESPTNGRYYDGLEIPVARTDAEKQQLLKFHYLAGTMIEVLVDHELALPDDTRITCFHADDLAIVRQIVDSLNIPWGVRLEAPPGIYNRSPNHVHAVEGFVAQSLGDPNWRGDGLEFDNV